LSAPFGLLPKSLSRLHLPAGGRRYRTSVEDVIEFVANERLATPKDGWEVALEDSRAELCVRATAALGADYAGVDLLRAADGRDYVIEVNAIPGWHGVESATGVDVAATLVEHLERGA
jgi:hypothetical protein